MVKIAKSRNRTLLRYLDDHRGETIELYDLLRDSGLDAFWNAKAMGRVLTGLGIERVETYRVGRTMRRIYLIPDDWNADE